MKDEKKFLLENNSDLYCKRCKNIPDVCMKCKLSSERFDIPSKFEPKTKTVSEQKNDKIDELIKETKDEIKDLRILMESIERRMKNMTELEVKKNGDKTT